MFIKWNKQSLSAALSSSINFECNASSVSIDSRSISSGQIFLALTGKSDGHLYIKQALDSGAACAIAEHVPNNCSANDKIIIVSNTLEALNKLALYQRNQVQNLKAIAVTGSVGKTTTKEMLASVLENFGKTTFSKASYNNHIGVPFTLETLEQDSQYGVFEVGMNHFGEIAPLSKMIRPDIAIITTLAPSHIGHLGSMEGIADEKSDIFSGLNANGSALIHGDHPLAERMKNNAKKHNVSKLFTAGKTDGMDAQLINYQTMANKQGCLVTAKIFGKNINYSLKFVGEHYAFNSLYVLLCAEILGLDLEIAAQHLSAVPPVIGRGQMLKLQLANGAPIFVFDDAYNANPTSMKAGLKAFCEINTAGKRIAILGQMGELGDLSDQYHIETGEFINTLPIDCVHVVGAMAKPLYNALSADKKGIWSETVDTLKPNFISNFKGNENLFLKGSNSQRLQELVSLLKSSLSAAA
jgi:UDP-N-acetylmuramoyl-tripeptide--D-alanyl-D-alanine ligase